MGRQKRKSGGAILASVLPFTADIRQPGGHVGFVPILLQKSFSGEVRKF
jgi:hypothetical protein